MDKLREKYPEYFDLSTFKGLEVYVWQINPSSYYFGIMMGTNRVKTDEEIWNLKGASAEEIRAILSSYDIEPGDIFIIPVQHPVSSYISEYFIINQDESNESIQKRQKEYEDRIRVMLGL